MIEHIGAKPHRFPGRWLGRRMAEKAGRTTLSPDQPAEVQRARLDKNGDRVPPARGVAITRIEHGDRPALRFIPEGSRPGALLYLHGGGYSRGSAQSHKPVISRLSALLHLETVAPDYRLAPEHPCPAAIEDALASYRQLRRDVDGPIIVAGDSAGGGLSLALTLRLKAAGEALPDALILFSPWADLTISGGTAASKDGIDPMLRTANLKAASAEYVGEGDASGPDASPLFADLSGLPPTLIQVGEDEILLDDSLRLSERLAASGVAHHCEVWEKMWHDFQLFAPLVREADIALRRCRDWAGPYLDARQA